MPSRFVIAMTDLPFSQQYWARLEKIFADDELVKLDPTDTAGIAAALDRAEIALLAGDLDERHIGAPHLKWVHVNLSGMTFSARREVFQRGLIVTGVAGRSAPALAEHAFMFMLVLGANFLGFYDSQRRHKWKDVPGLTELRAMYGRTIGIIGLGATGREIALRAKAFNMRVLGYRRRDEPAPPGVDRVYSADRGETIDPILAESDVIVTVVNLSDKTHHMIGRAEFDKMKPGAIIINLARGGVIDEVALLEALRGGRIGGAGVDVFDQEPLPSDSPLWDAPNLLITPHFSAPVPDRLDRTLGMIEENYRRYKAGEAMLNRLTEEDLFTQP